MELFRIFTLHLAVFAIAGIVVLFSRLIVRVTRAILLTLECRQLNIPERKPPVFAGGHPVLLRMEQGAAGNFTKEESEWPGQISI